jgi:hypothetical protein
MSEEEQMQTFLDENPCRCGERFLLTGGIVYTTPLQWNCICKNRHKGLVGFTDIYESEIVFHSTSSTKRKPKYE